MWRDICLANRAAVLEELAAYEQVLVELRAMLEANDGKSLEALFERARNARNAWVNTR